MATLILDERRIKLIIQRIVVSVKEFFPADGIPVFAGIQPQGLKLAHLTSEYYFNKFGIHVPVISIHINKSDPSQNIVLEGELIDLTNKNILLLDDVLNSGRTMAYALSFLLHHKPASVKTGVLVDRDHKIYPVAADFYGIRLATSLENHVRVHLDNYWGAWLE